MGFKDYFQPSKTDSVPRGFQWVTPTYDELGKSPPTRHPGEPRIKPAPAGGKPGSGAGAGVHNYLSLLDSGFRRNDGGKHFSTFCETINI